MSVARRARCVWRMMVGGDWDECGIANYAQQGLKCGVLWKESGFKQSDDCLLGKLPPVALKSMTSLSTYTYIPSPSPVPP